MHDGTRAVGTTARGQSVYDFSIGVSLFLVVVLGALLFVPSAFASANSDASVGGASVVADRVAADLTGSLLSAESGRLDGPCTLALVDDDAACGFAAGNRLAEDVGVGPVWAVNVTLEAVESGTRVIQCWDSTVGRLVSVSDPACNTALTAGSNAADNQNYAIARRSARFGDTRVVVVVRVW